MEVRLSFDLERIATWMLKRFQKIVSAVADCHLSLKAKDSLNRSNKLEHSLLSRNVINTGISFD